MSNANVEKTNPAHFLTTWLEKKKQRGKWNDSCNNY